MGSQKPNYNSNIVSRNRLDALERSELLNGAADNNYDGLAEKICLELCAPIGLISLVDTGYQFFKGQSGLPPELETTRKTPLSQSLCREVVCQGGMVVVDDIREHPLYFDHPIHTRLGVVAYIGEPLLFDGEIIGAVCAVDIYARHWTGEDKKNLRNIALEVQAEVYYRYMAG